MHNYKRLGLMMALFISLRAPVSAQSLSKPQQHTEAQDSHSLTTTSSTPKQIEAPLPQTGGEAPDKKNDGKVFKLTLPEKSAWDWLAYTANIVLVAAGIGGVFIATQTLGLVRRQSNEIGRQRVAMQQTLTRIDRQAEAMEKQTEHLKDSVELSFKNWMSTEKNFQAMKSKERARLTLEIGEIDFSKSVPFVNYKLSCHGTTPAYVAGTWHSVSLVPVDDFFWSNKDFGVKFFDFPSVIPNGVTEDWFVVHGAGTLLTSDMTIAEKLKKGDIYLFFRAWIKYQDIFDDHHTLYVSKIYGVKKTDKTIRALSPLLNAIYANTLPTPDWNDSAWQKPEDE